MQKVTITDLSYTWVSYGVIQQGEFPSLMLQVLHQPPPPLQIRASNLAVQLVYSDSWAAIFNVAHVNVSLKKWTKKGFSLKVGQVRFYFDNADNTINSLIAGKHKCVKMCF